jgi:hypothetical protein
VERIMVKLITTISIALSACAYDARFDDCTITCEDTLGCPDGFACGDEGLCRSAGSTDACNGGDPPDGGSPPPISFMQAKTSATSGTTLTFTLDAAVSPQDALVVCLDYPTPFGGPTLSSTTDSLGNDFQTQISEENVLSADTGDLHIVIAAYGSQGGPDTITLTMSASLSGGTLMVAEYSGLALSDAADAQKAGAGSGTAMDSGEGITNFGNELVLGYAGASGATPGSGFTERAALAGNILEDEVVSTTGTYDATATTTAGPWAMIMVTFRGR